MGGGGDLDAGGVGGSGRAEAEADFRSAGWWSADQSERESPPVEARPHSFHSQLSWRSCGQDLQIVEGRIHQLDLRRRKERSQDNFRVKWDKKYIIIIIIIIIIFIIIIIIIIKSISDWSILVNSQQDHQEQNHDQGYHHRPQNENTK